jgi:hypothetical protein
LKADNSSLKSWCIRALSLQRVKLKVEIHYGANPLASRKSLPGPIFVRLHRLQAVVPCDPFVHFTKVAQTPMGHTSTAWNLTGYIGVNLWDAQPGSTRGTFSMVIAKLVRTSAIATTLSLVAMGASRVMATTTVSQKKLRACITMETRDQIAA